MQALRSVTQRFPYSVAILGAAGGIGQPLALLQKLNPKISEVRLFDVASCKGIAADLSHIATPANVEGFDSAAEAVKDADFVVIPAGVPRKPGMTRDDLFNTNASIVSSLVADVAKNSPNAFILLITNPINSVVPIAANVLKEHGLPTNKLMGVTSLDKLRAKTFYSDLVGKNPSQVDIEVIGGHAGCTILPVFSVHKDYNKLETEEIEALTHRVQFGGDEVVQAKEGTGSATLSMAVAGNRLVSNLINACEKAEGRIEVAYIENPASETGFFASSFRVDKTGIKEIMPVPTLSEFESSLLAEATEVLKTQVKKGLDFKMSA
eukprot:TRINITY_DN13772_c0_g1_i1.p1 TRINITY_DN13772_c0_g1~~TRINITY_DN13772_c0_g1_i1.p1  ORF type:complete len:322 (+),score=107.25 TRINITY_DN13772_c0_g1_i1:96-1061(+)